MCEKYIVFLRKNSFYYAMNRRQISALLNNNIDGQWVPNPKYKGMLAYKVAVSPIIIDILNNISEKNTYVLS